MTGPMPALRRGAPLLALLGLLAACQQPGGGPGLGFNEAQGPEMGQSGQISPLAGTLGGAGIGALAGRLLAGSHDNAAAILGGALIGGLAGNLGTNAYNQHKEEQTTQQYAQQQLAFTQSQQAQQEALNQQLESQDLYDQWGRGQGTAPAPATHDQVVTAQRMLTVLGLYNGTIDGVNGPATSTAIAEFQKSRGMPVTGNVTPQLLSMMKVAI